MTVETHTASVIELEGEGAGRAKQPTLAYDGLEIDIPFTGSNERVGTTTP